MTHRTPRFTFALASLIPAVLLAAGALEGGGWIIWGLLSMTALVLIADRSDLAIAPTDAHIDWLPRCVGLWHFILLGTGIWALGASHLDLSDKAALVFGMGLYFGQVSNACAHELIHRTDKRHRLLGAAMYCSLLNGQHVSAHRLVHHVHACTSRDPNSAPLGQGFWRFWIRAIGREFCEGWRAEKNLRGHRRPVPHPYFVYVSGAVISLLTAFLLGGPAGLFGLIALAIHAHFQLMLSDYLQHYGLQRQSDAAGRVEPMGPQHSWNAPQAYSAALMMNAPLHSDHHINPARTFPQLRYDPDTMPTLPHALPVMGVIALVPPLWRRMMDPLVHKNQAHPPETHDNVMPGTGRRPSSATLIL